MSESEDVPVIVVLVVVDVVVEYELSRIILSEASSESILEFQKHAGVVRCLFVRGRPRLRPDI